MSRRTIIIALLVLSACESKSSPTALPAQTVATARPPEVVDKEVTRFLDGMLVTSNIRPTDETTWPVAEFSSFWSFMAPGLKSWGIESKEALRKAVAAPVPEQGRNGTYLTRFIRDTPLRLQIWKQLLKEDPLSLEAAYWVMELENVLNGPQASLAAIENVDFEKCELRDPRAGIGREHALNVKALLLFRVNRLKEAQQSANAAIAIGDTVGARTLAKVLLAQGRKKEALTQAQRIADYGGRVDSWGAYLTLGLAQQANGLEAEAKKTFALAVARWPHAQPLKDALAGEKKSLVEWDLTETADVVHRAAGNLAFCGALYAEVGELERSAECYRRADLVEKGPAEAYQLVSLGMKNPDEALAKLKAVVTPNSPIDLMSALGWMLLQKGQPNDARVWVERALALNVDDKKASSLMWQICGIQKDWVCVIEYRRRLGLPTHFNVEQYRDVSKAWAEQALKNGEGLAAPELPSADAPKPPRLKELHIVPLGARVAPELTGVAEALGAKLPGIHVVLDAREDLPPAVFKVERSQVLSETLFDKLREEPGRLYVIEQDLGTLEGASGFAFARLDLAHGRGVLSVSRLRSLAGLPTEPENTLDGVLLAAAQARAQSELLTQAGRLLGLTFPCTEAGCAMRHHRSVAEAALSAQTWCPKHVKELQAVVETKEDGK